jgi:hypothetical protein
MEKKWEDMTPAEQYGYDCRRFIEAIETWKKQLADEQLTKNKVVETQYQIDQREVLRLLNNPNRE